MGALYGLYRTSIPVIAYFNGKFQELENCALSPLDRGFLFGDSVYEVLPVYHRTIFRCEDHLRRLDCSLNRIAMNNPHSEAQWKTLFARLIAAVDLADFAIYLQISRGVAATRELAPPVATTPTVFAMIMPLHTIPKQIRENGASVITADDRRWGRCDIKSTNLLASVMLGARLKSESIYEAIMLRDGYITEGTTSNVFIVAADYLATPPSSRTVLAGITRKVVREIAQQLQIVCNEKEITRDELLHADEVWLSSSTRNIVPVTRVDGQPIGGGKVGSLWHKFSSKINALTQP